MAYGQSAEVQLVWVTKYRCQVWASEIHRWKLPIHICGVEDAGILKGVVGRDHTPIHLEDPSARSVIGLV